MFKRPRTLLAPLLLGLAIACSSPSPAAASCAGAGSAPSHPFLTQTERATVCLINAARRAHGLAGVRSDALLRRAARRHSSDMVRRRYFEHTSLDGRSFVSRIRGVGYLQNARFWQAGENIGWGVGAGSTARAIVRAWMNSPPHRHIILTPGFRNIGVGVVPGSPRHRTRGATYTADFGYRHTG